VSFTLLPEPPSPITSLQLKKADHTCTVTTAVLFWGAKKRQWAVADTMRRSVRRVTTGLKAMTPRTPHKMTFSPIEKRRAGSSFGDGLIGSKNKNKSKSKSKRPGQETRLGPESAAVSSKRDIEKGPYAAVEASETSTGQSRKQQRPLPPKVQVPASKFEMDSPKTPMWNKVFGR
jgi:hypothetical protein